MKWIGRIVLLLLLVVVIGVVLMARQQAINTVTVERRAITKSPADYGIATWEDITYRTPDDLTLHAYYIPPAADSNGATIIYVHGLTGTRQSMLPQASKLAQQGYGALLIELRAHGESDGDFTTFGITEINDIQGALDYLATRPEVNSDELGILGQSLGCIVTLPAAAQLPQLDVVVGQSCMADFRANVEDGVREIVGLPPFPFAPLIIFWGSQYTGVDVADIRPIDYIDDIAPRPVLLLHGDEDTLFRIENAEQLYAAANEPKQLYIVEGVGHSPFYNAAESEIDAQLTQFFAQYLPNDQ